MIDLGKSKKVTAVLKLNFLPRGSTEYSLEVKKMYVFNALNDVVDQTFKTFFLLVLFSLNCDV